MPFTQENRYLKIDTPLGTDVLLISGLSGSEGISEHYSYELSLLSENNGIVFSDIIGKNVTISISLENGEHRYFNGLVSRFSQEQGGSVEGAEHSLSSYTATIVPWLWLLTKTADSRIFQEMSVPDIVEQIFTEKGFHDYKIKLGGTHEKRNYCVQYRETDFNFISRLLEEEGIYYFFEHEDKKHTLVLADTPDEHKLCPHKESARYHIGSGTRLEEDTISNLNLTQEITPGKYTINDYNFETPNTDLKVEAPSNQSLGPGEREIYNYPGGYGKRGDGDRIANIRMQEEESDITLISGTSDIRAFITGHKFSLQNYYRDDMNDKEYVLVSLSLRAEQDYLPGKGESDLSYNNSFTCIPFKVPYRPISNTPKPVVEGVQTAIIVGPSGEKIYTDEHGRVKVQFHWDREGKNDENSSCWMRVSQVWAGAGWGAMHVPHVGHEVIVDFIEGDPDRPIITGRVYHGTNKPPDELPANKTKNYIQSWGDNDIIFENKDGDKSILIKQSCGNEIRMHESTPDIEIKQECGNEILMKASGPDIDIKQACGNQILMHEAEGIHMKDSYGNEVKLDSAAKFIRIASPTHNSFMEIGKSVSWRSDSNQESLIAADTKVTILGTTAEHFGGEKLSTFVGAQQEFFLGAKWSSLVGLNTQLNYAKDITKNFASRERISTAPITYKSEQIIKLSGGNEKANLALAGKNIELSLKDTGSVKINDDGIHIKADKGKIILEGPEIVLIADKVTYLADVVDFKRAELKGNDHNIT